MQKGAGLRLAQEVCKAVGDGCRRIGFDVKDSHRERRRYGRQDSGGGR